MPKTKKILKVLFAAADTSGPAYHDLFVPVRYFHKYNLLKCRVVTDLTQTVADKEADILGFQRQYLPEVLMYVRTAKAQNRVVTTICDDNVWELPPGNPANQVYTGMILERYNAILKEVHAVTTSTPYLRELILPHNPNAYIHRNLVEMSIHQFVSGEKDDDQKDRIRILWHGTPHHRDDITLVEPAIQEITKIFPQVTWVFMGFKPVHLAEYCPPERYEYYEFVPVESFYPAIASLDADIAFAPLTDHPFNWGKTARKAQEFAILGIPMILAPIRTYAEWVHAETCIKPITNDTQGWIDAFTYLITAAPEEQKRLAMAAYYKIDNDHNIDKWIAERAAVYYDVWNKVKGDNLVLPTDKEWGEIDNE